MTKEDSSVYEQAVKRALISVSDKSGLERLGTALASMGVKILSTGGTAKALRANGTAVTDVSDHTGFPEMLDGRVKTLHPKIHGGILARRDLSAHMDAIWKEGIEPIDLVVVNLYPFRKATASPSCTLEDAIENIDIGGPAMLRSAAKNWESVIVVVDPADYDFIVEAIRLTGLIPPKTRYGLACKVFQHTAGYDTVISEWMSSAGMALVGRKLGHI